MYEDFIKILLGASQGKKNWKFVQYKLMKAFSHASNEIPIFAT